MLWRQEVSRSNIVGAGACTCTLTCGRRLTRDAHSNPKFPLNRRCALVTVIVSSAKPAVFAALTQLAVVQRRCGRNGPAFGMGHFLDLGEFVGVDFALGPRAPNSLDVLKSLVDLIDEFSAQFATDPPCQPTLAWAACREYDGELSRNIEIFRD